MGYNSIFVICFSTDFSLLYSLPTFDECSYAKKLSINYDCEYRVGNII